MRFDAQCYGEYGIFKCGGHSLNIKVDLLERCPYYFGMPLLKLALKSRNLDTTGGKNTLGNSSSFLLAHFPPQGPPLHLNACSH